MKRFGGGTMLGMAVGEREVTVAEVAASSSGNGAAAQVVRSGVFQVGAGGYEDTARVGAELKKFLKEQKFSASKVVIGLPAKALMARERQVPPATEEAAAALLRLQAERQFPPELKEMVFDYAGKADASESRTVLLLAATRQQVDRAIAIAEGAGLNLVALTSSGLALSSVLAARVGAHVLVNVGAEAAELVVRSDQGPRALRHLTVTGQQLASANGAAAAGISALSGELLRTVTVAGAGGGAGVILWDGVGINGGALSTLTSRSVVPVSTETDLSKLDVTAGGGGGGGGGDLTKYGAAVALGLSGVRPELLQVDFLHTRLAPPKEKKVGRKSAYATAAVVALLGVIGYGVWDLQRTSSEIDEIKARMNAKSSQLEQANALATKLKTAEGWYTKRPPLLDALQHVTSAFPEEGTIWAKQFNFREATERRQDPKQPGKFENVLVFRGTLSGSATSRTEVLRVRDRLMNDKRFADVQQPEMHGGDATSKDRDVSFTINFTYSDGGGK